MIDIVKKIEEIDNGQGYLETVITIKREGDEFADNIDLSEDIVKFVEGKIKSN